MKLIDGHAMIARVNDAQRRGVVDLSYALIVTEAVQMQPAVDAAQVVHGKWMEEPDRVGHYHCSKCGVVFGVSARAMKFCPGCGAKMMNSPLWDMEDETDER